MVEISYNAVMDVTTSWDKLKCIKNYENKAGDLIFSRVFDIEPSARKLFKFSETEDIRKSPKYAMHAQQMVDMIDCAVAMLGPDMDPLAEELERLGRRHVQYGVSAQYLPVMEKAVVYTMEELLGDKFTRNDRNSWSIVFYFMIKQMTSGME